MPNSKLLLTLVGGLAASVLLAAAPASAAVVLTFGPGVASPTAGYTIIDDFNSGMPGNVVGGAIQVPPANGTGAPPANSVPAGTPYLTVVGGQSATINFGGAFSAFQFDWGSIDSYNTLTIHTTGGDLNVVPGTPAFPNLANGNQVIAGTNGLFTVTGNAGEKFTGITLASSQNSFEIDNVAVAVPEPASWALMLLGFGGLGAMMRRRRTIAFAS